MKKNIRGNRSVVRKLAIRSETLKQLTIEQLDGVVGAAKPTEEFSRLNTICRTSNEDC